MARSARAGGKTGGAAKGRKVNPVKGRSRAMEAREQQAATAEILKVIARSRDDVQPVFDTIVSSAARLVGGVSAGVYIGLSMEWST
jgi:hypothetical protein